jgi:cytochrome b561
MHWLMLFLIAAVCALMELKSFAAKGSDLRTNLALLHYLLGLAVFVLVWLRMLGRIGATVPPITPLPPLWQSRLAKAIHWVLYALAALLHHYKVRDDTLRRILPSRFRT